MADAASPFEALEAIKGSITQVTVLQELQRWDALPSDRRSPDAVADMIGLRLGVDDSGGTSWGTRFGPWATFGRGEKLIEVPDRTEITAQLLDVWERRVRAACHPVLRARYADLVWDLSPLVRGKRPSVDFPRKVIDAVIEGLQQGVLGYDVEAYHSAGRALALAKSINDPVRAEAVERAQLEYERTHARDRQAGTWGKSFDIVLSGESRLQEAEQAEVVADLERRLERLSSTPPESLQTHKVEAAAMRLAKYYRKQQRTEDMERVLRVYAGAFRAAAQRAQGMVATTWLEKVLAVLEDFGLKEDAETLVPELREHGKRSVGEMKTFTTTFKVTKEEMDEYLGAVLEGDQETALRRITFHFVPDPEKAEEQVRELAKTAVLSSMISKKVLDEDGRTVSVIRPVDDDIDDNIVQHISQGLRFSSFFLRQVLVEAGTRLPLNGDAIMARVRTSPVFHEQHHALVEEGLRQFFEGHHAPAIHLLVPQIEAAVRNLALLAGANTYKRNPATKLLDLRLLHDLLRDPHITAVLTERITLYLRILLVDPRGWNLRNEVCHGMLRADYFTPMLADRVLHVLMLFLWFERKGGGSPA